ncbi:stellacyanin-like [Beta vulgaris subsp. vulgaris]|uniref:stellacyanin-like n=1 Tax=Beta vulgaris subsp. vulgaris TaxID=3555 RepID=UPI00254851DB|nr:stellacyanin-like [Beta vulgaris subsp. vulgaris]
MSKVRTELECGIIIAFLLGFLAHSICSHKVYIVGDDQGWNPNVDYKAWACGKTFYQGDILEFKYTEGFQVQEVTAKDFEACNRNNPIFEDHLGTTAIPLNTSGPHFFICGSFDYCNIGMKLNITVNCKH